MAGAAVGAVASSAVITKLQSKRLNAGAVLLHNTLAGRDDPTTLKREEVVEIGNRYADCQARRLWHRKVPNLTCSRSRSSSIGLMRSRGLPETQNLAVSAVHGHIMAVGRIW